MEEEKQKLFLVKKTQLQMVRDRGYDLSDIEKSLLENDYAYFNDYIKSKKQKKQQSIRNILTTSYQNRTDKLYVYYATRPHNKKKISGDAIKIFFKIINENQINQGIIIYNGDLSTSAKNELSRERQNNGVFIDIQIFQENELVCNPIKHNLTPRHVLLSEEEKKLLLAEIKIPALASLPFPIIFTSDAVVKYYNWKAGSIVKVYRNDDIGVLTPETIAYRVITKATVEN